VFGAILFEIERVLPEEFFNVETLRSFLRKIGKVASDLEKYSVSFRWDPDQAAEEQEERHLFEMYIESLSAAGLETIAPLPYRHVLADQQAHEAWELMRREWGHLADYYYEWEIEEGAHLKDATNSSVIRFGACDFVEHVPLISLHDALRERGILRLFELTKSRMELYEIDVDMFVPRSAGVEMYWTSGGLDWIMYGSDDGILTIGGEWLIESVKQVWPHWEEGLEAS
jgi:hypothetical protein